MKPATSCAALLTTHWGAIFRIEIVLLLVLCALGTGLAIPRTATPTSERALIVYDNWPLKNPGTSDPNFSADVSLSDALQLKQLLGHFPLDADIVPLKQYHAGQPAAYRSGQLKAYRVAFFIGNQKHNYSVPEDFLADVRQYRGKMFWLNYDLGQLGSVYLRRLGLEYDKVEFSPGFSKVRYHNILLTKGDVITNILHVTSPMRCKVIAEAIAGKETTPYIVHSGDFWYVADSPFSYVGDDDRYFAFADVLHDFLGSNHKKQLHAIIRIEDINSLSDPEALQEVADRLHALNAPFVISLIPHYIDRAQKLDIPLNSRKAVMNAVRYMTTHGGTIAMHGDTHQYKGISSDDFEFINRDNKFKPIGCDEQTSQAKDSPEYVQARLRDGLTILMSAKLYPLLWETPHYGASTVDYQEIAKYFSSAMEQRILKDNIDFSQYFPFVIQKDIYGQKIYPENLGYVARIANDENVEDTKSKKAEEDEVAELLKNAKDLSVLRDVTVGAFIHPFLSPKLVTELVKGLQDEGYTFVDLRNESNRVQMDDVFIASGKSSGQVVLHNQFLHTFYLDSDGKVRQETISAQKMTGTIPCKADPQPGWIYVCHGMRTRPASWWATEQQGLVHSLRNLQTGETEEDPARAAVLWDAKAVGEAAHDQQSFLQALTSSGFAPKKIDTSVLTDAALDPFNMLVITQAGAVKLTPKQVAEVVGEVKRGLRLVIDGYSPLAEKVGITRDAVTRSIDGTSDVSGQEKMLWPQPENCPVLTYPEDATEVYHGTDKHPLGAWFNVGKGRCFALGTRFDPSTDFGFARYPTLPTELYQAFALKPGLIAKDIDLFFEPGMRPNVNDERIILQWKKWGVRTVHIATWHFRPNWTFPYDKWIEKCHNNGIAVYAWFELPYVTPEFCEDHKQWWERTATGAEAKPSWRIPAAIEVPECRKAILEFMTSVLKRYDWDGVNIAELYFENTNGPDDAKNFTPMHPYVREHFKAKYGYDPVELCQPDSAHYWKLHPDSWQQFETFRAGMLDEVYRDVLTALKPFQQGEGIGGAREVVVTALDTVAAPEIQRNTGLDIKRLIGMMAAGNLPGAGEKFDFTLNVEDPQRMWNDLPTRYEKMGAYYRKLVKNPARLMLDLNVVNLGDRRRSGYTSPIPLGVELYEMVRSARMAVPRVLIYCEGTISESDTGLLGAASAAAASYRQLNGGYNVTTPGMIFFCGRTEEGFVTAGDTSAGIEARGEVPLPAGETQLIVNDGLLEKVTHDVPMMRLLNVTGTPSRVHAEGNAITVDYSSLGPCLVTLDQKPMAVLVDGHQLRLPVIGHGTGSWTVRCPAGKHTVKLVGESTTLFGAQIASAFSSWIIVAFGGSASALLIVLMILTHLERRLTKRNEARVECG